MMLQPEGSNKEENTKSARTKCKAMVRLKRTADDGWYFSTVVLTHNHELADTAREKKVWKCHNTIDSSIKELIKHMRSNNFPVNKVYGVMSDIHGRHEEVPFGKRCLKNLCATLAHDSSLDDITKTLDIFSKMQAQNPDFFYAVKVDSERRVHGILSCHSKSRADYHLFGDVLTFDTTYKSNLYEMPVGLFVGVNNHYQSTLFGCVILREETEDSFKWAFSTFVEANGGKTPQTILTDQCREMEVAIAHTMPSTVHRLCKWHVMKSIKENLGALYKKGTPFRIDFNRLTNEMMTVDEFDRGWAYLMDTYGLAGNRYMAHIYDCRDKWAKPYLSSNFCAKMCSTQRNECMNNVLKSYVSLSAPLNRFVLQYNKLIAQRCKDEDFEMAHTKKVNKFFIVNSPPP
ncbi:protein FAR1-RELATED SEQUENCE 5-like isoform X2 [Triticum urartu]|uniref:protein FAR1-RELATED SEQUENCE 5-like isoform X2 n=1 Tax=Triticum urartu TaxID=4572 RepID=UPI0020447658|nr:protein FAR1-RELATED SEQUENCE 5-like isoform X2 [Triticum urartu]